MLTIALVFAGWAGMFVIFWRMLERNSARIRNDAQRQIEALSERVADLEQTIAIARALRSPSDATGTAAVVALVSKKVTVRSMRTALPLHPLGDPWAQQGRSGVQSSHDVAQRGH